MSLLSFVESDGETRRQWHDASGAEPGIICLVLAKAEVNESEWKEWVHRGWQVQLKEVAWLFYCSKLERIEMFYVHCCSFSSNFNVKDDMAIVKVACNLVTTHFPLKFKMFIYFILELLKNWPILLWIIPDMQVTIEFIHNYFPIFSSSDHPLHSKQIVGKFQNLSYGNK